MALLDIILGPIERLFNSIFGGTVVAKLVSKVTEGITHVSTLVERITHLIDSIKSEITHFANWKEDIRIKSRVINIPKAVEKTQDLIVGLKASWQAVLALIEDFKTAVKGGDPKAEAEEMAADLESLDNIGTKLLQKLPKLARGLEKLLGVVTLIVDAVITWSGAVDKIQTIVDEITRIREEIESLESVFLSQRNPRKRLKLAAGGSIRVRVGNLHR